LVVNVEYTLVPQAAYPQQVLELNQAVEYIVQHQNQLPIDLSRVFLVVIPQVQILRVVMLPH
jgi:acetyl esterase/lipase